MSARRPPQWVLCPFYRTSGADALLIPAMLLRSMFLAAAATALPAAPAAADPGLVLKPCYVVAQENQRELVNIVATGYTPLAKADVFVDEVSQGTADVLYDGTVRGSFPAPFPETDQRDFTVGVTEQGS